MDPVKLTLDENILVANLGNGSLLVELQVVEGASALNSPLLLGRRCHCVVIVLGRKGLNVYQLEVRE